ncbi:hypothetical protein OF83DRAFT_495006 [Amylostereum chailletii]|nr:hypothetical protein OF83DRAFT_495006 [Amylostereum chailletii]
MRQATSTVYTCGCADLTTKSGGAGVWWGEGDVRYLNIAVRTPGYSKNRAALLAVVKALECTLASYTRNPYTRCHLTIRTQTKYTIRGAYYFFTSLRNPDDSPWTAVTSRFKKFSEKDWQTDKGQRVNNADLIQYLHALLKYHEKHHGHATLMYIWGQSSELGRIRSSNLAIQGTRLDEEEAPDWMARQGRLERMQEDKAIWVSLHYLTFLRLL